jgi:hypothetical protein
MADKPVIEKTFNEDVDVSEKVRDGGVLAMLYLEVQGGDEKSAKDALENTVFNRLLEEEYATLLEVKMYEIKKEEGGYYSGVAEVKILARDFRWFINTIMRYGPSAIEIVEPGEYKLSGDEMHSLVADVSEIVHAYTTQIMSMLKDDERLALYNKLTGGEK